MSYDYNALVLKIHHHRQAKEWQDAVETFSALSTHCPMTPLLWIQYAHDTGQLLLEISEVDALEVELDTLELGLGEFPGCALLQLHYAELLLQLLQIKGNTVIGKVRGGLESSLAAVGHGSHRNEDVLVVQIYQLYANFVARHLPEVDALSVFVKRAKVPMLHANDSILSEMESFASQHNLKVTPTHIDELEQNRRHVATWFQSLYTLEDDIDEAMQNEQILPRFLMNLENVDWGSLIPSTNARCWMGLGGATTAHAFIKYAQACSRYPRQRLTKGQQASQQEDLEFIHALALPIYERGIAECPTVDSIWLAYLRALTWLVTKGNRSDLAATLRSVANRAIRNCPYSLELAQYRIGTSLTLAMAGHSILDPDVLLQMVDETIQANFLTDVMHHLQLYMAAIKTVKRRILFLLAHGAYDEPLESGSQGHSSTSLTEASDEEIQDLIEDLRELYDAADKHLCKKQCANGRVLLWTDRCNTETYLLTPLMTALDGGADATISTTTESVRCFDKLLKIHPHPDSFRSYIQMLFAQPVSSPQEVAVKFQRMRHFFQNGLHSTATRFGGDQTTESARQNLCSDYLQFEQIFGSEKSLGIASRLVQKVMPPPRIEYRPRADCQPEALALSFADKKRKQETIETSVEESQSKRTKVQETAPTSVAPTEEASCVGSHASGANEDMKLEANREARVHSKTDEHSKNVSGVHKVKIGKLEFPAHPLTIRVSNLAPETEDMDLVDTFRPKCGAIVHAKIIREKHHHHGKGASKGWGLVQFESQDSVDKALELNDIVGLHDKILQIGRSHMPAASLVPPGMHRVQPKGEGKFSKRNVKVKDKKVGGKDESTIAAESAAMPATVPAVSTQESASTSASLEPTRPGTEIESLGSGNAGVLAFQPRGVARRKQKVKITK